MSNELRKKEAQHVPIDNDPVDEALDVTLQPCLLAKFLVANRGSLG